MTATATASLAERLATAERERDAAVARNLDRLALLDAARAEAATLRAQLAAAERDQAALVHLQRMEAAVYKPQAKELEAARQRAEALEQAGRAVLRAHGYPDVHPLMVDDAAVLSSLADLARLCGVARG